LILWTILCNFFINDLDDGAQCTLQKFADDAKVGRVDGRPDRCAAIHRDLHMGQYSSQSSTKGNVRCCTIGGVTTHTLADWG